MLGGTIVGIAIGLVLTSLCKICASAVAHSVCLVPSGSCRCTSAAQQDQSFAGRFRDGEVRHGPNCRPRDLPNANWIDDAFSQSQAGSQEFMFKQKFARRPAAGERHTAVPAHPASAEEGGF